MERVKVFMEGIHWLFQGFYSISRSPNDVMDSFQVLQGTLSSNLWSISRIGSPALSGDSLAGCLLDLYWYFFLPGFDLDRLALFFSKRTWMDPTGFYAVDYFQVGRSISRPFNDFMDSFEVYERFSFTSTILWSNSGDWVAEVDQRPRTHGSYNERMFLKGK